MILIVESNTQNIILRRYPTKQWFAYLCLTIFIVIVNYLVLFKAPIYSTLTCDRGWFNTINCQLDESALFRSNLRHQTIKNVGNSQSILNNGRILLNTEIDLLHNNIKNNYFPSHSFLGFYDVYLYRFQRQALNEVQQINNFIHSREQHKLKITRKLFPVFYILLLLFPATILIGILCILFQPTITYIFNFQQNNLMVVKKYPFTSDRKKHSINKLQIASVDEQKKSILLNTDTKTSYLFDRFKNKQEASKIVNQLQRHLKHSSFSSKQTST